jgi:hypothetical protein
MQQRKPVEDTAIENLWRMQQRKPVEDTKEEIDFFNPERSLLPGGLAVFRSSDFGTLTKIPQRLKPEYLGAFRRPKGLLHPAEDTAIENLQRIQQ